VTHVVQLTPSTARRAASAVLSRAARPRQRRDSALRARAAMLGLAMNAEEEMPDDAVSAAVLDRATRVPDRGRVYRPRAPRWGSGRSRSAPTCSSWPGFSAALAGEAGVTVGAAGLTVTLFAVAYAPGALLLGAVLGARALRQVLIGSVVLFGLFNVVLGIRCRAAASLDRAGLGAGAVPAGPEQLGRSTSGSRPVRCSAVWSSTPLELAVDARRRVLWLTLHAILTREVQP
jgi:hypothetical protein